MKRKNNVISVLLMIFFIAVAVITLLPLALLAVSSLRPGSDLMRYGLNFSIDWANANLHEYQMLFSGQNNYFVWYRNSLVITVVQVTLALLLSACVGYGFAMYDFKFKNAIFVCVLLVMMVPTEVILLPLYRLISGMKLTNSMWGVILPYTVVPMLIFFFRQYLSGISKEFVEAARVDGAGKLRQFKDITLPLLTPTIFFNLVMQMINGFLAFTQSYIITQGRPMNSTLFYTVYMYQQSFEFYNTGYGAMLAWIMLAIVGMITLVLFATKKFWVYEGGF